MQTNPVWRMVRALIATYILSGILLAILSFALFKFRLPETSQSRCLRSLYPLLLFWRHDRRKNNEDQAFFWGLVLGSLYFLFYISCPSHRGRVVTEDTKRLLSVLAMCTLSGMAGGW